MAEIMRQNFFRADVHSIRDGQADVLTDLLVCQVVCLVLLQQISVATHTFPSDPRLSGS
jgi:hypothetical protein